MPIYEYEAVDPDSACRYCGDGFEIIQGVREKPLSACLHCGKQLRKTISWCHAAVMETSDEHVSVGKKIKEYEHAGMWSHAAELADKHSEKIKDKGLKMRALDNYSKAGYDADSLAKHIKNNNE